MIIKEKKQHNIEKVGDFLTIKSSVNKNKLVKLYSMLSAMYRNPKGAIVREYTSNAYDANKEAYNFNSLPYDELVKIYPWLISDEYPELNMSEEDVADLKKYLIKANKDEPIIVGIDSQTSEDYFYVQDYGIGLSPERMKEVFFDYLSTTKDNTDDELGGFGIGAKSALAYTNMFFIDTVYKGTEYRYMMGKNEKGEPEGSLLDMVEGSNKSNGTLIKIPIDMFDIRSFGDEIESQLLYIPNVFVKHISCPSLYEDKFNDSNIYKGNGWVYNPIKDGAMMHICLENINYSIDWSEIKMSPINIPIAITFNIGELHPTPSRESVIYTDQSRELIVNRINDILTEFITKANDLNVDTNDFEYYLKYRKNGKYNIDICPELNVNMKSALHGHSRVSELKGLNYKGFKGIRHIPDNIFFGQSIGRKVSYSTGKVIKETSHRRRYYNRSSFPIQNIILDNDSFSYVPRDYEYDAIADYHILERFVKSDLSYIKDKKVNLKKYVEELKLNKYPKSEWRRVIVDYTSAVKEILEKYSTIDASKVLINPNWHKEWLTGKSKYSPVSKKPLDDKSLFIEEYRSFWNKSSITIDEIKKFKGLILYSSEREDVKMLYEIGSSTKSIRNFRAIRMSNTNMKKVKEANVLNAMTIEDVFTSRIGRKLKTILQIEETLSYKTLMGYFPLRKVNRDIGNKLNGINQLISQNIKLGANLRIEFKKYDEHIKPIYSYISDMEVISEYLNGLDMLEFTNYYHWSDSSSLKSIKNYILEKGKKIDIKALLK